MKRFALICLVLLVSCLAGRAGYFYASGGGGTPTGLIGWYKFDDGSGTTPDDSSGEGNHGSLVTSGGSTSWVAGHIDGALRINAYHVELPANAFDLATSTSEITVACWIYFNSSGGTKTNGAILDARDSGSGSPIFYFVVGNEPLGNSNSGKLAVLVRDNSAGGLTEVIGSTVITNDTWHHVAMTRNSSKLITLYLDGVSDGSGSDTMSTGLSSDRWWIGVDPGDGGTIDFEGDIDDFRIYSVALSGGAIADLAAE